jgi:hypothetical protein
VRFCFLKARTVQLVREPSGDNVLDDPRLEIPALEQADLEMGSEHETIQTAVARHWAARSPWVGRKE